MGSQQQPYAADTAPILTQADDTEGEEKDGLQPGHIKEEDIQTLTGISPQHARLIVCVLFFINLLNYMDRFTVAGVLPDIEKFFEIDDSKSGLLQTVFIISYMILAPIFGYLGDRWNRKYLMCIGIFFWSIVTLGSSYTPKQFFWMLLLTRGLVGVGEASYSTIAPTIIADLYLGDRRSRMLSIFYFAIPVGSGLGYIVGSKVKDVADDWHWALRVTPGLGAIALLLLITVVREPPRGAVETRTDAPLQYTSWAADVWALSHNRSFVLSSLGFTAVAFVTGSLALWAPAFLYRSRLATGSLPSCPRGDVCHGDYDSLIFGVITCVTGVLGVSAGVEISRRWHRINPRSDPLVCAIGLLGSAPFLFLAVVFAQYSIVATYVFIFIGEILLSLNWAIVADILLYVVIPTRRSTAEAFQILLSHLLGDAGSPYLIGLISDRIQRDRPSSLLSRFRSLEYALMICAFVGVIGGGFFLATACFIQADRKRTELYAQGQLHESLEREDRIVVPQHGRSTKVPVSSVLI